MSLPENAEVFSHLRERISADLEDGGWRDNDGNAPGDDDVAPVDGAGLIGGVGVALAAPLHLAAKPSFILLSGMAE